MSTYFTSIPSFDGRSTQLSITVDKYVFEIKFWLDDWVTDQELAAETTLDRLAQSNPLHYIDDTLDRTYSPIWWISQLVWEDGNIVLDKLPLAQPHTIFVEKDPDKKLALIIEYYGLVKELTDTKRIYDRMDFWRFRSVCNGDITIGYVIPGATYMTQRPISFKFLADMDRIGYNQLDQVEIQFEVT